MSTHNNKVMSQSQYLFYYRAWQLAKPLVILLQGRERGWEKDTSAQWQEVVDDTVRRIEGSLALEPSTLTDPDRLPNAPDLPELTPPHDHERDHGQVQDPDQDPEWDSEQPPEAFMQCFAILDDLDPRLRGRILLGLTGLLG